MKKLVSYLLAFAFPVLMLAQLPVPEEEKPPTNAAALGVFVHTFGFGLEVQYFRMRGKYDLWFMLSAASQKSLREQKILSRYHDQGGEDFILDKKNYFYKVFLGVGVSRLLVPRTEHNKVGIRLSGAIGPVIGLLKPYYVEVAVSSPGGDFIQEVPYDASKYTYFDIFGEADYFLGIGEMKALPGVSLKVATLFDFSKAGAYIRGIELGLYGDFFTKRVPIFDQHKNAFFFGGGSVELLIGNAW